MRAGGVGGVAWLQTGAVQSYSYGTGGAEVHVPLADHMGNVRHYYQFKSTKGNVAGQLVASYEYDAFGREVRAWGLNTPTENQPPGLPASRPWADLLPFHYSSKLRDVDSGFNYYGYRFYDPGAGRWLNRDPIGERGGVNLYGMCYNAPVNGFDDYGLAVISTSGGMSAMSGSLDSNSIGWDSERLRSRIDKLSPGDNARIFLNTQKAILDKLADGRCCLTKQQLAWLERVIRDFMNPLIDSLDGRPTSEWNKALNSDEFPGVDRSDRSGEDALTPLGAGAARLREVVDARTMAVIHIGTDLMKSLRKNGIGDDLVWACVGQAVREAEEENFSPYELNISRRAGRALNPTFDVGRFRDDRRDAIRLEGAPAYSDGPDQLSLYQ